MRKVSNSSRKIEKFLSKSLANYANGFHRALNLELNGKRYRGQDMKNVSYKDGTLKFCVGEESLEVKLAEITKYKRLRTKKYLFSSGDKKASKKVAKKTSKKATKKTTKKQDGPTKQNDEE